MGIIYHQHQHQQQQQQPQPQQHSSSTSSNSTSSTNIPSLSYQHRFTKAIIQQRKQQQHYYHHSCTTTTTSSAFRNNNNHFISSVSNNNNSNNSNNNNNNDDDYINNAAQQASITMSSLSSLYGGTSKFNTFAVALGDYYFDNFDVALLSEDKCQMCHCIIHKGSLRFGENYYISGGSGKTRRYYHDDCIMKRISYNSIPPIQRQCLEQHRLKLMKHYSHGRILLSQRRILFEQLQVEGPREESQALLTSLFFFTIKIPRCWRHFLLFP